MQIAADGCLCDTDLLSLFVVFTPLHSTLQAGQTKFKTAAIEYIRTMGLTPKVVASSNHLGNNDMRNLATADKARMAKLRVKHDIFAPWEEDIDHKVSVMFTPMINDEKRDFVEYTSLGFLSQTHTMVTYTRASDSVLCVPLMIGELLRNRAFGPRRVCTSAQLLPRTIRLCVSHPFFAGLLC